MIVCIVHVHVPRHMPETTHKCCMGKLDLATPVMYVHCAMQQNRMTNVPLPSCEHVVQADSIEMSADDVRLIPDALPVAGSSSRFGMASYTASYTFAVARLPTTLNLTARTFSHGGAHAAWGIRSARLDIMAPQRPVAQVRPPLN